MNLTGCTILNTRPASHANGLSSALEKVGGNVLSFPTIEIVPRITDETREVVESNLATYDLAVFVSPNAVWQGVSMVREVGGWPPDLEIAVVGAGTAAAVEKQGLSVNLVPDRGEGATALLTRLAKETVDARRVVIFRGRGGLPTLGDELTARGALVTHAEVYAREMPDIDPTWLNTRGSNGEIDIIVVTSAQAMRHLFDLLGDVGAEWLRDTPFLVVSERIARLAEKFRLTHRPLVAQGASDSDIVETLVRWRDA